MHTIHPAIGGAKGTLLMARLQCLSGVNFKFKECFQEVNNINIFYYSIKNTLMITGVHSCHLKSEPG